jgi:hypothetical protein
MFPAQQPERIPDDRSGEQRAIIAGVELLPTEWNAMDLIRRTTMDLRDPKDGGFLDAASESSVLVDSEARASSGSDEFIHHLQTLEAKIQNLQALVCDLLVENEELRWRNDAIE